MQTLKNIFGISFIIIINCITLSTNDTLTIKQMQEDVDYYFDTIEKSNPLSYVYYSKAQIDSVHKAILAQCSHPMCIDDFNYILFKINQYTDGHTNIYWDKLEKLSHEHLPFPPFTLKDECMYIKKRQIISVNNVSSKELVEMFDGMISWEIHPISRINKLNYYMPALLYLRCNIKPPYHIQLKENEQISNRILEKEDLKRFQEKTLADNTFPFYFTLYEKESIAIFNYNTSLPDEEKKMDFVTNNGFKLLKREKIKYLFIDVSRNGGGDDNMHQHLFDYILNRKYTLKCTVYYSDPSIFEKETNNALESHDENKKLKKEFEQYKKQYYSKRYIEAPLRIQGKRTENKYKGKIYVIQGNNTYSAGSDFCYLTKYTKRGLLVGQECGQQYPYSASSIEKKLPNSQIRFRHSTKSIIYQSIPNLKNGFIQPDIWYDFGEKVDLEDCLKIIELSNR